ncbi:ABC transporter substrate-binding protein [Psychroflexus sp. ALD_RP9]|uniref:ABC transporter substrate-binding protein n=1 Tax=Psychroflexus sp. ALD_RP9 TaxID=2777186 RepID=UPI001A8CF946|nr:ABC transporter substrate-binding protein [Psychroflexus sp. ALD_RP9]QSS96986.1 ABC transporter substrate-binding protein [Psychroflexus sp. ALD_RP9]
MKHLRLALDWTPNVNHIGFYVAKAKLFYQAKNIKLDLVTPDQDNYSETPAKKVELGKVDFALCPTESLISYQSKSKPFPLVGLASIFQSDLSAICVLKSSKITRPQQLDGKHYASYQARYEDGIVKELIKNDGGHGSLKLSYPEKLGIWETLIQNKCDATWIFYNWEALQAEAKGIELELFKLKDFGIPYSYSPVIAGNKILVESQRETYKNFIEALREGFLYAQQHPEECAKILAKYIPEEDKSIDLVKAINISAQAFGNSTDWGRINTKEVDQFLNWLKTKDLEHSGLAAEDIFIPLT